METARMLFLKVVLTNDPDNVAALTELGWKYEEEEHNYDAAVSTLKRALEVAPESADAAFWLAKVYYHDGSHFDLAKECLEQALRINANHVPSLSLLASVYDPLGERERAIPLLERAVELEPTWVILHSALDWEYTNVGKTKQGRAHAEEALRLARQFADVSTEENYTYYEDCVTGRWVRKGDIEQLRGRTE